MKGSGLPLESRGKKKYNKPQGEQGQNPEVKMMRTDGEQTVKDSELNERSQSVVEEAVKQVMGMMHNIKPSGTLDTALGPTPTSQITLDNAPVEALLDTGSPISIVSLEFYLKTAAQKRTSSQSPAEWGKEVLKKLMPTTVSLRSYGGNELEIVSQAVCHLERDGYQVKTALQVQKGAPVDLLLGTDVLSQLGFSLMQASKQGMAIDLLQMTNTSHTPLDSTPQSGSAASHQKPETGSSTGSTQVKLIQAVRLPARHSKLIHVDVSDSSFDSRTCLFEPQQHMLRKRGLVMADAVVGVGDGKEMALLIANHGSTPARLEREERYLEACSLLLLWKTGASWSM